MAIIIVDLFNVRDEASLERFVDRRPDLVLNRDDDGDPIYTDDGFLSIFVKPGGDAHALADELARQQRTMLRVVEVR